MNHHQSRSASFVWALCVTCLLTLHSGCQKKDEEAARQRPVEIIKTQTDIEMVRIPAGWFEMGSQDGSADETPRHRVFIDAFLMDRCEVTQAMYSEFPLPDPSHFKDPQRPVEQINWTDALAYCNERSLAEALTPCYDIETGECDFEANGYRLPTEAEWEYACRAGTETEHAYGKGEGTLQTGAWYKANAPQKTQPVAGKRANAWGLYDMHGNVKEWCHDYYGESFYQESPDKNPRGPEQGSERVIRGGGWDSTADSCRSAYRASDASLNDTCLASDSIGFRCVRNMPPTLPADQ